MGEHLTASLLTAVNKVSIDVYSRVLGLEFPFQYGYCAKASQTTAGRIDALSMSILVFTGFACL
jgi:hypothetical protein